MSPSSPRSPRLLALALLVLPLVTLWNLSVARVVPRLGAWAGPVIFEPEMPPLPGASLASILSGDFQRAVSQATARAIPLRGPLIRINNELRYDLFDMSPVATVGKFARGELFELFYIKEYCARRDGDAARYAEAMLPRLLAMQTSVRARGAAFLYLITPSKAAHLPEDFVQQVACGASGGARELAARYATRLRDDGIAVLDLATMTHELKSTYGRAMFPRGGTHWNPLAAANAGKAVVEAINAGSGHEVLRPFDFTYYLSSTPDPLEHDLELGLNLLVEHYKDAEPRVVFNVAGSCAQHGARQLTAAAVGGSFLRTLGEVLQSQGCLTRLQHYFYLRRGLFGFQPYHLIRADPTEADVALLRTADILLVEENENYIGRSEHFGPLYDLLLHPEPKSN